MPSFTFYTFINQIGNKTQCFLFYSDMWTQFNPQILTTTSTRCQVFKLGLIFI